MRYLTSLLFLALAAVTLAGCNALGLTPRADAPAYSGVGVLVVGNENEPKLSTRTDQSGAVGASGSASQTLEVPAETVEALVAAAQSLIAAGNPEAAAAVLGALAPKDKPKAKPATYPVGPLVQGPGGLGTGVTPPQAAPAPETPPAPAKPDKP